MFWQGNLSLFIKRQVKFFHCFSFFQRNDIAMAITKFDQFDFLIDIVPRDDLKPPKRQVGGKRKPFAFVASVSFHFSSMN